MARDVNSADLNRQQKARAQRVDHAYHARPHPWRTWMWRISILLPVIAAVTIVAASFFPQGSRMHLPGPVSTRHAIFADNCGACHDQSQGKWGAVSDAKCIACHDGPPHHLNMVHSGGNTMKATFNGKEVAVSTPTCASCHAEHKGHIRLADIVDTNCTQCHANLQVNDPPPKFAASIADFARHVEWKVLRENKKDGAQIKLNHAVHMTKVKWPAGGPKAVGAPMACTDCHIPDASRTTMQAITYQGRCATCHPLSIPPLEPGGEVKIPHASPETVASVVTGALSSYLIKNGGRTPEIQTPNPDYEDLSPPQKKSFKGPKTINKPDPRPPAQWIDETARAALHPLFFPEAGKASGTCMECHISSGKDAAELPLVNKPGIPTVWLKHAKFNHETHRVLDCKSCHARAETSTATEDVLIPGIKSCQECHKPVEGARTGCVECHAFHNKDLSNFEGMHSIEELQSGILSTSKAEKPRPEPKLAPQPGPVKPEPVKPEPPKPEPPKPEPKVDDSKPAPAPVVAPAPAPKPEEVSAKPEAVTPPVEDGDTVICRVCGLRSPMKAKWCARCGTRLK